MLRFKPLALLFLFFASSCATVPITGRRSLHLVSDRDISTLASNSYRELIQKSELSNDQKAVEMIRRVGQKIAAVSNRKDYDWEYNLIVSSAANAFCMPGGKVAFFSGILPITQNEAGVAVVMGHEVAHAIAQHGAERLSQQLLVSVGGVSLDIALQSKPEQTRSLAFAAFGLSAGLGFILPYSRLHESEADHIGLIYMAKAGYNPNESIAFWQRMESKSEGAPPEFLSTHPHHKTRIKNLKKWMPEAMKEYQKTKTALIGK